MRFLEDTEIYQVISYFDMPHRLTLESSAQIEPDAFLYVLANGASNKYGLLCRDYMQDDAAIEARILNQEHGIIILNWIKPTNSKNDYRIFIEIFDAFPYMFALFRLDMK